MGLSIGYSVPTEGSSRRVDENEWMRAKNPRLGKEDKKADLLPFEKL